MIRPFALLLGVAFLIAGIAGFAPFLVGPPDADHPLLIEAGHGYMFGLFPINYMHNFVHIAVGIWGLMSARSFAASLLFARGLAIFYGLLAVLGSIPATDTLFGLVPIHGHDVWLHGLTALAGAYFGWMLPRRMRGI